MFLVPRVLFSQRYKSDFYLNPHWLHAPYEPHIWHAKSNVTYLWSSWTPFAGWFWHLAGARPPLTSSTAESLVLLTADPPWVSSTIANPPNSQCPVPPTPVFLTVALWWRKSCSNPWWDVWYSSRHEDPALIAALLHCWPIVFEYC